jgi:hypothetical protein
MIEKPLEIFGQKITPDLFVGHSKAGEEFDEGREKLECLICGKQKSVRRTKVISICAECKPNHETEFRDALKAVFTLRMKHNKLSLQESCYIVRSLHKRMVDAEKTKQITERVFMRIATANKRKQKQLASNPFKPNKTKSKAKQVKVKKTTTSQSVKRIPLIGYVLPCFSSFYTRTRSVGA